MSGHELELKAVILAAGKEASAADAQPMVLQPLGGRKVLDYVVENALQVVAPEDLYVVVGPGREEVPAHLGAGYHYVVQGEGRGTGHAVLQLYPLLKDFDGHLLILYGDTPLFRPASIRGLLNRHRLRQASLTLLAAVVDRALPYGRIIRDAGGKIVDIIEEVEASPEVREIRELNAGAYVVRAEAIFRALAKLPPSLDGDYLLTDCVHQLIRSGLKGRATASTTKTRCRASTHTTIWPRPSLSCRSGSTGRTGRKSRTWWPSARAAGVPSSARALRCTTYGGSRRPWPTPSSAATRRGVGS